MPFSSLVNGSSTGKEGAGALLPPRNLASFRTDYPTIRPRLYRLRGYPGRQANRQPGSKECG